MSDSPSTAVAVITDDDRQRAREEKERNAMIGQAIPFALSGGLAPASFEQMKLVASMVSSSGYFADARDVAKAMVKIQYGAELGIPIMSALNNINIIEGKPSLSAALVGARIMSSGLARYIVKVWDDKGCVLDWLRKYDGKWEPVGSSTWTIDDSKNAGLMRERSNHMRFPKAMCFARAMTSGARAYCPDLFFGAVYDADELRDEVEVREVREAEPKTGAERLTAAVEKAKAQAVETRKVPADSSGSPMVDVLESTEAKAARRKAKASAGESATSTVDVQPAPQPSPSPTISASAPPSGEAATPSASPVTSTPERGPIEVTEQRSVTSSSSVSTDPTPASTHGASTSTPTPSTSTDAPAPGPSSSRATEAQPSPVSSPTSTTTDDGEGSDALAELDAMAPKGSRLLDALVTIPSDSKKAAAHLKEKRDGMSPAEVEIFRCTLKQRVTMLLNANLEGDALRAKLRMAPADEIENAARGASMAAGVGLVWARELTALLS